MPSLKKKQNSQRQDLFSAYYFQGIAQDYGNPSAKTLPLKKPNTLNFWKNPNTCQFFSENTKISKL